jgi:hypothetical protein
LQNLTQEQAAPQRRAAAAALIVWCAFPSSILPFALSVVIYRQSTSGVAVTLPFTARARTSLAG